MTQASQLELETGSSESSPPSQSESSAHDIRDLHDAALGLEQEPSADGGGVASPVGLAQICVGPARIETADEPPATLRHSQSARWDRLRWGSAGRGPWAEAGASGARDDGKRAGREPGPHRGIPYDAGGGGGHWVDQVRLGSKRFISMKKE